MMARYIDADKAIILLGSIKDRESYRIALNAISKTPTEDVQEVKHGKWVFNPDDAEGICTSCNYKIYGRLYQNTYLIVPYNFCPNCGAKMDNEKE